ncbi:MAG TPA: hypothetical protein GX706_03315 [Candidatus Moranbacteria bacterium]|nr:hypothetical protein [Candidatus Moranbacteria bacterium]
MQESNLITERQERVLAAVIKEYTETALPVSSGLLIKKYRLPYSSATVRNEMVFLEQKGFLRKPHVSAGRVPSDKGYRYFIDHLMEDRDISQNYVRQLEVELLKERAKNARLERTTAKLLSSMSKCLVVSGTVNKNEYFDFGMHNLLADPEFSGLDEFSKMTEALDLIDENVDKILAQLEGEETKIFIGKENPIKEIQDFSMMVTPYKLESGEKGLVALIGPKRMKYGRNKKLMDYVKELINRRKGEASLILIILGNGLLAG